MTKQLVISIRNAAASDFGGGEKVPVYIAREVTRHSDVEVIVCTGSKRLIEFAIKENVPFKKTWWSPYQNWSGKRLMLFPFYIVWQVVLFFYYVAILARLQPAVVHLQSKDDFIAGTIAARLLGKRVVWSDYADLKHVWMNHSVWYKNPIGKIVYAVAFLAHTIIVVSEEDKRLVARNIPGSPLLNKLEVIYYGAFDTFKDLPRNKVFTICSASRLVQDKGIGELIQAFDKFNKIYPQSKLQLLGDGPDKEKFMKQANKNPAIEFLGYKTDPSSYVERSEIFVLPTYHEGFSLALVEACMLQTAIIATDVGGNPEIIKNMHNGLLVEKKNSGSIYSAIVKLYEDENLRTKLACNARLDYQNSFNFETIIINKFIPLYGGEARK